MSFQFNKHNYSFTLYIPGYWQNPDSVEKLDKLLEQKNSNQKKLHVEEGKKTEWKQKVGLKIYQLSDLEVYSNRNDIFKAFKQFETQ